LEKISEKLEGECENKKNKEEQKKSESKKGTQGEEIMLMIDVGGAKMRNDQGGKWKIVDMAKSANYVVNLNDKKLPFKDNEVMYIYCSHTLEHLEPDTIPPLLVEFKRVLSKYGVIRIGVPDCELAVKWYLKNPNRLKEKRMPSKPKSIPDTKMGRLTSWFYTPGKGHRIGFDFELLHTYLKDAGFHDIRRLKWRECSIEFEGKDLDRYQENTLYVEAKK
jgi:predicted SAM-dependent methyltransferase